MEYLNSRQTCTRNEQMLRRSTRTRMDNQRKYHIDPEGSKHRNRPKQLLTDNLPTDAVENIDSKNKGRDLLLAKKPRIVPWGIERIPQGSRGIAELLYKDQHILNECKIRRKNIAMALIDYKKAYDMVPESLIISCFKMYKISDGVINFIEKNHENLQSGINSRQDENTRRKGNVQILGHLGGWHHQTSRDERKNSERIFQEN